MLQSPFRKNAYVTRPPLIVDFPTKYHKQEFLTQCRSVIKEFKDSNTYIYFGNRVRCRITHWINQLSIAPDRSFEDRQKYKALKVQLVERNNELIYDGIADKERITNNLELKLIQKGQREE